MKKLKGIDKFTNFMVSNVYFYNNVMVGNCFFYNNVLIKKRLKLSDIIGESDWVIFNDLKYLIGVKNYNNNV